MVLKRIFKKKNRHLIATVLYGITTLLFVFLILKLDALPLKYELLLLSPLVVLFLLILALTLRVRRKTSQIIMQLVNILLCIGLMIGSFYVAKGSDVLSKIAGANRKTYTMSLIVQKDAAYETLDDLAGKTIVLNTAQDAEHLNTTMEVLKQKLTDINFSIKDQYAALVEELSNGTADAILINEAYRSMLEVENENFSAETRVIWTYEITSAMADVRKSVDVVNTPFVVYISGIDTYGSISTVSRTDVNMIVTVNPNTKQILMTSIPRDAWVKLANMNAYDKLTHSGIEGVENSILTLENFLGITINYYARVNFSSVLTIVDALGGIDVSNDMAITTASGYYIPAGDSVHLNGDEALAFARERHAYDYMYEDSERGDQRRVENQQAVLEATLKKIMSPKIITNYTDILSAVEGMFETNMTAGEITDLIAMQLDDMASWDFISDKITGHYEYQYGGAYMPDWNLIYYMTDEDSVDTCVSRINAVLNNQVITES